MKELKRKDLVKYTTMKQTLYKEEDYRKALREAGDLLDRALLIHFVLGDTAKRIVDQKPLEGIEKITLGVRERALNEYALSTLKTMVGDNWRELEFGGVPVEIKVIKNDRGLMEHPDIVFYGYDEYFIPNSFEKYWKMRGLIK